MLHLEKLQELSEARKSKWRGIRCALGDKYQRDSLRCFWFHGALGGLFGTDGFRLHFVPATIEDEKMWNKGYNPSAPFMGNDAGSMMEIEGCLHKGAINQIVLNKDDFVLIKKLLKESDAIQTKFIEDKKLAEKNSMRLETIIEKTRRLMRSLKNSGMSIMQNTNGGKPTI